MGYVVLAQAVRIKDEQIEAVKNWPEPTSVRDIQVFIGFTSFYQHFIQNFSKIATLLIFLLKTTESSKKLASKAFRADDNKVVGDSGRRANETMVDLSKNKKSRNLMHMPNIGAIEEPNFLSFNGKKTFNYLRFAFIKAPIL